MADQNEAPKPDDLEIDKEKIVLSFESVILSGDEDDFWKNIDEIKDIVLESSEDEAFIRLSERLENSRIEDIFLKTIESTNAFIKNTKGEYTTKKIYEEKTPFFKKMKDQFYNKFE